MNLPVLLFPQLNQYIKANSVILELLDEAKIDILKIFDMASLLSSAEGERLVKRRAELFALQNCTKITKKIYLHWNLIKYASCWLKKLLLRALHK